MENPDFVYQIYEPLFIPYFRKELIEGVPHYFFARELYRESVPIEVKKPEDEVRVVIIGESVAAEFGSYSSDTMEEVLAPRFPDHNVKLINAGMHAYTSPRIYSVAQEVTRCLDPDLVLILMGNNAFDEPVRLMRQLRHPPPLRKLYLNSRVYRFITDWIYEAVPARNSSADGKHEFRSDYIRIADLLSSKGIPFAVFMVPHNEDWPFYFRDNALPWLLIELGYHHKALTFLNEPENWVDFWLKAKAHTGIGENEEARKAYIEARKKGYAFSRGTNDIIQSISDEYGAFLINTVNVFESVSEGPVGNSFFIDDVHWYPAYNRLLADHLVRMINKSALSGFEPVPESSLLPETPLNHYLENARAEKQEFIKQGNRINIDEAVGRAIVNQENFSTHIFRLLIRHGYIDEVLRLLSVPEKQPDLYLISDILGETFSGEEAEKNWFRVLAFAGEGFRLEGDNDTARRFLNEAIKLNPEAGMPYLFRALTHLKNRQKESAVRDIERAFGSQDQQGVKTAVIRLFDIIDQEDINR